MKAFTPSSKTSTSRANAAPIQRLGQPAKPFVDNRFQTVKQRKLQQAIDDRATILVSTINSNEVLQREKTRFNTEGDQTLILDNSGRTPITEDIKNGLHIGLIKAKTIISEVIDRLSAIVSSNDAIILNESRLIRTAFGIASASPRSMIPKIIDVYSKTLAGLSAKEVSICDVSKDDISKDGDIDGYVDQAFGIKYGPIHTKFDMSPDRIAFNLIHEGTHRWANTEDVQYINEGWNQTMNTWNTQEICNSICVSSNTIESTKNLNTFLPLESLSGKGHVNADSYSVFAFAFTNRTVPSNEVVIY